MWIGGVSIDLPKSGLSIATDAATGAINTTLLSEGSRRPALLPTLLDWLLLRGRHPLGGRPLLLHTITIVLLRELVLLVGVVLECHFVD